MQQHHRSRTATIVGVTAGGRWYSLLRLSQGRRGEAGYTVHEVRVPDLEDEAQAQCAADLLTCWSSSGIDPHRWCGGR